MISRGGKGEWKIKWYRSMYLNRQIKLPARLDISNEKKKNFLISSYLAMFVEPKKHIRHVLPPGGFLYSPQFFSVGGFVPTIMRAVYTIWKHAGKVRGNRNVMSRSICCIGWTWPCRVSLWLRDATGNYYRLHPIELSVVTSTLSEIQAQIKR